MGWINGSTMADAAVSVTGLRKSYGDVEAVCGIDLTVYAGETFGFLGPNGAGKSTTIGMLCTLVRPTGGRATVALPAVGGSSVVSMWTVVDFPAPFGPRKP